MTDENREPDAATHLRDEAHRVYFDALPTPLLDEAYRVDFTASTTYPKTVWELAADRIVALETYVDQLERRIAELEDKSRSVDALGQRVQWLERDRDAR